MAQGSDRSIAIDNAKGILILLVIWGHMVEPLALQSHPVLFVYSVVYLFHIPAFAFLAGMVSRRVSVTDAWRHTARRLLVPFIVFQVLYWPALAVFAPTKLGSLLTPSWILWFLVSLATWRLALPLVCRLPQPLLLSLAAAVAVGYVDDIGRPLSLSRTVVFFPAFLAGHLYGHRVTAAALAAKAWVPVSLLAILILVALQFDYPRTLRILYGSTPYEALPVLLGAPALDRMVVLLAGGLGILCLLALTPRQRGPLTWLGRRKMSVYLLHGFVAVVFWVVLPRAETAGEAAVLGMTAVLSVAVAFALGTLHGAVMKPLAMCISPPFGRNRPERPG